MFLTLPYNESVEMSFKIGIAGTQSKPTHVAVVLGRDGTQLSYKANAVGDEYVAKIDAPGRLFGAGHVKAAISIILNGKVFTPYSSTVQIESQSDQDNAPKTSNDLLKTIESNAEESAHPVKEQHDEINSGIESPNKSHVLDLRDPISEDEGKRALDILEHAQQKAITSTARAPKTSSLLKSVETIQPKYKRTHPSKPHQVVESADRIIFELKKVGVVFK